MAPLSVLHYEVRDSTAAIIRFTINKEAYDNYIQPQEHRDQGLAHEHSDACDKTRVVHDVKSARACLRTSVIQHSLTEMGAMCS
ncbi:hypothetical protein BHE90_009378 [Fusarium euwallaceae]|uniref:Uncharacterized protein n=4 Tax=Fusarium solani species complex TaxID=232080 RepID=A0A3M2S290_9HYPO|nr:hypothetical protein CDV36_008901 [Fusarium kuroshium]RSL81568.1 hypothetical protein CEP51_005754 [Fusarium floridanum]RSM10945.1 hypothetical protein CEP52_003261 [Fusarium oligoseptatum]RTE76143.1 hypothetical protein BHE90_009378 [Fusarium euwallaceae]